MLKYAFIVVAMTYARNNKRHPGKAGAVNLSSSMRWQKTLTILKAWVTENQTDNHFKNS